MSADAIHEVTFAIRDRLKKALGVQQDELVFVGPLHDPGAAAAHLVLFLYRICPNGDLRNTPHVVPNEKAANPPMIAYDNALPLDLYFLLTAGRLQESNERDALLRLGQAMQALNDAPLFVGTKLKNQLARVTIQPASSEEMSRVWALFPEQNYRTSVLYLVSPVWIDPAIGPTAQLPVTETPHHIGPRAAAAGAS